VKVREEEQKRKMRSAGKRLLFITFALCFLLMTGWPWWQLSRQEGLSRVQLGDKRNSHSSGIETLSEDSAFAIQDCVTWTLSSTNVKGNMNPSRLAKNQGTESALERRELFEKIWETNAWDPDYKSGYGSALDNTENVRRALDNVVNQAKTSLNKKYITLLDSSCGDMNWMPTFLENRTDVIFTGFDIVSGNIEAHKKEFAGKPWKFEVHDIVLDPVGKYDIILSRHTFQAVHSRDKCTPDVELGLKPMVTTMVVQNANRTKCQPDNILTGLFSLVGILSVPFFGPVRTPTQEGTGARIKHLRPGDINRVIANFVQSGSGFLLATNQPKEEMNGEMLTKSWHRYRPVNLFLEPYNLPLPLCASADFMDGLDLMLWDLASIGI